MFDPYYKWLGILPKDQPPNYYRLLSLELYEGDLDVIEGAADRQMGYIRQYQSGEHAALAAKLLNEIATARICLLKAKSKAEYDAKLKKELGSSTGPPPVVEQDVDTFRDDVELPALLQSQTRLPSRKSKKSKSPPPLWIAGGVGAGICLIGMFVFFQKPNAPQPETTEVVERAATPTITSPTSPTVASKAADTAIKPSNTPTPKIGNSTPVAPIDLQPKPEVTVPKSGLLQLVDLGRDKFAGEWKREGTTLISEPRSGIYLPVKVPDDYQLRFNLKRISGDDTLFIGFLMAGRLGTIVIDGWNSQKTGIYLDGAGADGNCSTFRGAVLRNNRSSTIFVTVHPGHLHLAVDGKTIIDWYGDSLRIVPTWDVSQINRELPFLATANSSYQIESAEIVAIEPEPPAPRLPKLDEWMDIMPLLATKREGNGPPWELIDGSVQNLSGQQSQLWLPIIPPEEYSLSAMVEVPADVPGDATMGIGLVAGNHYGTIIMKNDDCLGLERIDGQRWNSNVTRQTIRALEPGKTIKIVCTVTKNGIRMDADDRALIDWKGELRRLSAQEDWVPADTRKIFFGTSTRFRIRNIRIGPPVEPRLPEHSPMAAGKSVDLLALVDPRRDALKGTWTREGPVLRVMGDAQVSKLVIPCEIPAEYKLTMRVAREPGGGSTDQCLTVNLPFNSSMAEIQIDAFGSTISGMCADRLPIQDPLNTSMHKLQVIPPNKPVEIVMTVRKSELKVTARPKTVFDWTGNPSRCSMDSEWCTPIGRIALASYHDRFRFEKLVIEPLETSPTATVAPLGNDGNLLSIIDPKRDSRRGEWKLDKGVLVSPPIQVSCIRLPVAVPSRYVLSADVERRAGGGHDFYLGLAVGGNPCAVSIDGQHSAGLMNLDNKSFYDGANPTRRVYNAPLLPTGKAVKLRAIVLPDTVIVTCGDKEVVRWHGDARRLSLGDAYKPPNYSTDDREHLWIGAWESEFLIRELTLKPLDDDEAKRISEGFSGVFPITSQANVPLQ